MRANPDKFQLIVLNRNQNKIKIHLNIGNTSIENKENVKLLGITIDSQLLFKKHTNTICDKVEKRLLALIRIRKYLSQEQAKVLANSYNLSAFKYCNLIWMFCAKKENNRINKLHKRALRCVYDSPKENFEELLDKYQINDIHTQNLQSLMLFIYKVVTKDCPEIVVDMFRPREVGYNLRAKYLLDLPKCKSNNYGVNTMFFKGIILWNNLPNKFKELKNSTIFKKQIRKWKPKTCTCKICS